MTETKVNADRFHGLCHWSVLEQIMLDAVMKVAQSLGGNEIFDCVGVREVDQAMAILGYEDARVRQKAIRYFKRESAAN
jgi:hypothetical protein